MVTKVSDARRRRFIEALTTTGNVTMAAARAKVSRRWAGQRRRQDLAFAAECAAAVAAATARFEALGEHSGRLPPEWRYLQGEELVVRTGRGGRRMLSRARLQQWSASSEAVFLRTLAASANLRISAAAAGLSVASAYVHRARSPHFAAEWTAALAAAHAKMEAAMLESALCVARGKADLGAPLIAMSLDEVVGVLARHADRGR